MTAVEDAWSNTPPQLRQEVVELLREEARKHAEQARALQELFPVHENQAAAFRAAADMLEEFG